AELMRPTDLAGLIIDGFQYAFTPDAVIRPCPSESSVGWLGEVNPVARMCADHEEPGLRVKAGRPVVCHAALVRSDQSAIAGGLLLWIGNRASLLVYAERPVRGSEGHSQQALPIGAIDHKEVAVTRCLQQHLVRFPLKISVDQHRNFDRIPIVRVMGRRLKSPAELSVIGVERDDTAGVEIISRPGAG